VASLGGSDLGRAGSGQDARGRRARGAFDAGGIIVARTAGVTVEIELAALTERAASASVPNAKRVSSADRAD
jgi:hypothetical protein